MGACTRQTVPAGPKFSGRLLLLTGDSTNGADLVELTTAPTGSTYNLIVLTKGVFEAAPSPDRTRLLYTTKDDILLRDLRTGAVKSLVKGENYCLAWSPDGNRFSYKQKSTAKEKERDSEAGNQTKLYVSDLDGKTRLISEGLTNSDCAHWIAADRLIF